MGNQHHGTPEDDDLPFTTVDVQPKSDTALDSLGWLDRGRWDKPLTLEDAFEERPALDFVIEGIFPAPSLSIVYAAPGELKSMLLMDAAVCVAGGIDWLAPLPGDDHTAFKTHRSPVFWYDFDNGKRRCAERFQALAKGHGLSPKDNLELYFLSMPHPQLEAKALGHETVLEPLEELVEQLNIKLVCIDNLATVSRDADENSGEMVAVMSGLRHLAERYNLACVVIHHERKSKEASERPGESLRGHSSINAAIDLALQIERTPGTNRVIVQSTKTRGESVQPFAAHFSFTQRADRELETGIFHGASVQVSSKDAVLRTAILAILKDAEEPMSQDSLKKAIKAQRLGRVSHVARVLKELQSEGKVKLEPGAHNTHFYSWLKD